MGEHEGKMIVKANKLVRAKMPLTKLEHRVVALLISQLSKDDEEFSVQKLPIRDLHKETDSQTSGDLYRRGEEICQSLLDKKLEIKRLKDGKRKYKGINLMDSCEYLEGDGYIEAKFNESMKPYLLQLKKRFTMYQVGNYVPLSSTYSMRVYELLKMREGITILRVSVEEFRDILGVEDSYSSFSQLKYHVIGKAQEEIQEKTDIHFTYDVEREGRSAERIKFFIHQSTEDEGDTPKMEDRTEAPDIDVMNLFLSDLTQDQIDNLNQETLDALHERAVQKAERQNPDRSENVIQAEAYRHMKALWEKR
jgi:plasmid replication initiation protein